MAAAARSILAAIFMVATALLVTACGDVETNPTPDTGFDAGIDTTPDAAGPDSNFPDGTPDGTPDAPKFSYAELCFRCERLGLDCPPESHVLTWQRENPANTEFDAAAELCITPPPSPCDGWEWIEDELWQCDWLQTSFTLLEVDGVCRLAFEDGSNDPFRQEGDMIIIVDDVGGNDSWRCLPIE